MTNTFPSVCEDLVDFEVFGMSKKVSKRMWGEGLLDFEKRFQA